MRATCARSGASSNFCTTRSGVSVFASAIGAPSSDSVTRLALAMAALQPNTLNRASAIRSPLLRTWMRTTVPSSKVPISPVPTWAPSSVPTRFGSRTRRNTSSEYFKPSRPQALAPSSHRRHLAKPRDDVAHFLRRVIHVFHGRRATDSESQRTERAVLREPQREKHMRRFRLRARRT